ncbi:MAG: zf-HC2 domain-containing protein [Azonexus sp.]
MLTCKNATQLLSEAQDRKLGLSEKMQLELHLALCKGCKNYGNQMKFLSQTCRRFVEEQKKDGE